jgi:putative flavoprotein involved in K+ transport
MFINIIYLFKSPGGGMEQNIETVIIGGGQAGLCVSYFLRKAGRDHIILEQADRPAHTWRDERWDSFTLVTPNWSFRLPGAEYQGPEPEGFIGRDEIVQRFEQFVENNAFPIECGVQVTAVDPADAGYRIQSSQGNFKARNVVVATGMFQTPRIPEFSQNVPGGVTQIHSSQYRNPQKLAPGAVLVVGSSQSGCQIAEELNQAGRKVYLCVGSTGRAPRRYRGKDIYEWMESSGFLNRTVAQLPSPAARFAGNPLLTGKDGGHSLNLHQFSRDGIHLLGRLSRIQDGSLWLAPDLKENLVKCDRFEQMITEMVDAYIARNKIEAPQETVFALQDGYSVPEIPALNISAEGITTIIWATGFRFDYSLVHLPVFDEFGFPITQVGASRAPGLYFAGMSWLPEQDLLPRSSAGRHPGRWPAPGGQAGQSAPVSATGRHPRGPVPGLDELR